MLLAGQVTVALVPDPQVSQGLSSRRLIVGESDKVLVLLRVIDIPSY